MLITNTDTGTLVIKRKIHESVTIDGRITVEIRKIGDGQVRLAITAPKAVPILRTELKEICE